MYKITLVALALCSCACSPLRKVQTTTHEQITTVDTTLTELIRREVESRFGTLQQTIVEFYPPAANTDTVLPTESAIKQPVKRIIYTNTTARADRIVSTDSISRSRINTAARSDTQTQTEEKPSSGVAWLKWATALAVLILLILLFFKLR